MDLYTRRRVAGRERPSEVMERVRLFLAECGAEAEREPHAEHADRRQTA